MYVGTLDAHAIRKITPDGTVTTFAGQALEPGAIDAKGSAARFSMPWALAVDAHGVLWVIAVASDFYHSMLRTVAPDGTVTLLAGKKGESGSADGPGDVARFNSPTGIVADASGTLYVSDSFNNAIRTIRCR